MSTAISQLGAIPLPHDYNMNPRELLSLTHNSCGPKYKFNSIYKVWLYSALILFYFRVFLRSNGLK